MTLKLKVSCLVLATLVVSIGGLAAVLAWSEGRVLADGLARRQTAQAESLAEVCRNTLFARQDLFLTNYLKRLKDSPEVLEAYCVDADDFVVGHTDPARAQKPWGAPFRHEASMGRSWDGDRLEVSSFLALGESRFGTARVVFNGREVRRRLDEEIRRARRRIAGLALPVLVAGGLMAFLLTALALRPMKALVAGARAIGSGALAHRIPAASRDELGLLAGEFNQMAVKLAELDEMKKDFVNGVTHDLKGPLAAVRTATDLAQDRVEKELPEGPLRRELAERFLTAREGVERLRNLVTSILEVARIEQGLPLDRAPVKLEDVLRRASSPFRLLAEQKGLSFDLVIHRPLPALSADGSKLERLAANLIGNAVKFTTAGKVTVELNGDEAAQVVRVSDTGPGIPPEALGKLFTKFYRVRRPGEKVDGTGLGLSIARGIAEAHGGTLEATSTVGQGTTFTLRIPVPG